MTDYTNLVNKDEKYDLSHIEIYDVTLRDGEQTPGVSFSIDDKKNIAQILEKLNIRYIEAGFPAVSENEANAVKQIVDLGINADIYAFCRLSTKDIDKALNCGVKHLVLFLPGTEWHLKNKLNISLDDALEKVKTMVAYAKGKGAYVRFGCEDASRTPLKDLLRIYNAAISAGADMVAFADTVGVMTPTATKKIVTNILQSISVPLAIHAHNDYGLAVANSIAAIEAGVKQVHVCLNGLGERCGNASFEELVMILYYQYGTDLNFNYEFINQAATKVYEICKLNRPFNKPVIGVNAFRHESGVHVQGIIKDPRTYEPFPPQKVGRSNEVILGKHSGLSNIQYFLSKYGFNNVTEDRQEKALDRVKQNGENKISTNLEMLFDYLFKNA